jgi:ribosomal protein L3 glutamine methyltransferase
MTTSTSLTELVGQLPRLGDIMRWGLTQMAQYKVFYGHGTDNAWDEMLQLAFGTLGLPLEAPPQLLDTHLLPAEREQLLQQIQRRVVERTPVPYLTNTAWFARLPFYVDERVLVPRSPFAEVLLEGLEAWIPSGEPPERLLELCTGSGCIAIVCALQYPGAEVVATDISEDALAVAQENVVRHGVDVDLHAGDLFADTQGPFDVILTNPPYVAEADWAAAPAEFHREPKIGLAAGEDGLDIVRRILSLAPSYLAPEGVLFVEVGDSQTYFERAFPSCPVQWVPLSQGGSGIFAIGAEDLRAYLDTEEGQQICTVQSECFA